MRSENDRITREISEDPLDRANCPAGKKNTFLRAIERKAKEDTGDAIELEYVEGLKNWHGCQFTKNTKLLREVTEVNITAFPNRPGFFVICLDKSKSVRVLAHCHKTDQAMKFCDIMYFQFVNIDPWPKW